MTYVVRRYKVTGEDLQGVAVTATFIKLHAALRLAKSIAHGVVWDSVENSTLYVKEAVCGS